MSTPHPGPRPTGGPGSFRRPDPRPATATGAALQRTASKWSRDNLAARQSWELEQALAVVCRHPDAYSSGYSAASSARQRLTAELASRVNQKLNNPF